ncbi:MAG: PQQ-binding-like beta-propeller repeat protein [Chloroflexi bacterium]|nr:PQQ-binding-like beta-propeller repeat protein [Chloroflexota bacterium]
MKTSRLFPASPYTLIALLLLVLVLAACSGGGADSWAGVSIDSDTGSIYVSYDKHVVAINPTSGATQWEYKNDDAKFFAVPVVHEGILYIGDYKGRLHSLNAETGEKLWVYAPEKDTLIGPFSLDAGDRVISGVAVDSNLVYFGLGSRNLMAVSRETGEEVWTFKTNHGVWATPLYVKANPDVNSVATVYVASLDHYLYAVNAQTGKELWHKDMGGAIPGQPAYDPVRNWLYVGTFVSEVIAVDLDTHQIVDRYEAENWVWGGPVYEDDVLYFGDLKGNLYALSVTDDGFKQKWKKPVADGAIRSTPLLTEDLIVVGSKDKHVYALKKADGASQWSKKTKGEALTELVFVSAGSEDTDSPAVVVAGTGDRERLLVAFVLATGEEQWHYNDKD